MSDEQLRTRITLLMQDVGWGIEGSYYIDENAVVRILNEHDALLESQNQALQEEVDRLRHVVRHESPDMISCSCGATRHGIAVENQALRERAEKAEDLLRAVAFDDQHKLQVWLEPLYIREPYVKVLVDKATDLLSPTQETDPE